MPIGGGDQRIAVGLAHGLFQRLVNQVHAVIGRDRHEVRPQAAIGLLECGNERFVGRRIVIGGIEMRGHDDLIIINDAR
jgi:hypothetical protein